MAILCFQFGTFDAWNLKKSFVQGLMKTKVGSKLLSYRRWQKHLQWGPWFLRLKAGKTFPPSPTHP